MKFKEETCENCGLDLTTAELAEVIEMPLHGEMVFLGECPQCHTNRIMVAPEPPVVIRGTRRRASEPEPEPTSPGPAE